MMEGESLGTIIEQADFSRESIACRNVSWLWSCAAGKKLAQSWQGCNNGFLRSVLLCDYRS
jgi:hypothetical protein